MLFKKDVLDGIVEGRITRAFRRWKRPSVRTGTKLRTPIGLVHIESVEPIKVSDVTNSEACRAGYEDAASAIDHLGGHDEDVLYRIVLSFAGVDPRLTLRERSDIDQNELRQVAERLVRFDCASRAGPWTAATLTLIAEHPSTPAGELAFALNMEKETVKRNVRKLKELGLTISLESGYRLSPRGEEVRSRLHNP